ncbi:MAG: sigma-70 family RNA polymerase sigma factor [Candidatus Paceibacterota bacterium]
MGRNADRNHDRSAKSGSTTSDSSDLSSVSLDDNVADSAAQNFDDSMFIDFDQVESVDIDKDYEKLGYVSTGLSALSAFQKRADRFPPLNNEQQLELAKVYRNSLPYREVLASGKRLGKKEEREANDYITKGDAAMEHLCASCWRLAWLLVREQSEKRFGKDRAVDMLPDLMAEANAALVKSVTDFDPQQTPKFHTYAARVIRDHLRAVLSRDGYMRLAPSWVRVKRMAVTLVPELTSMLSRSPTTQELQNALLQRCLDWADDHLTDQQRALPEFERNEARMAKLRKQGMLGAVRDIEEVLIASQPVSSLDAPAGADNGGATIGDLLPGQVTDTLYDVVEHKELQTALVQALNSLSDREREILLLRHGFLDGKDWTYGEIADKYSVTSERIRQIEKTALNKLASPHGQFVSLSTFLPNLSIN